MLFLKVSAMNELKEYIQKTTTDKIILVAISAVFAIAAYVLFTKQSWILFGAMLIAAVVLLIGALTASSNDKKFFDSIEASPERDYILEDFRFAKSYSDDSIRMGEKYIFTKKYPRLISYEDITKLRYSEHLDIETQRTEPRIFATLSNGKGFTLCQLYSNNPQALAQEIFQIVISRNPDVEIIV